MPDTPPPFVPAAQTELTADWLRQALSGADLGSSIGSGPLTLTRIGEAYGFASEITRCDWRSEEGPRSVIVKLWRDMGASSEILFYTRLAKNCGVRVPHCYHAATNRDAGRSVLVLEDLRGAEQGDCLNPLTLERAVRVAQRLADLHATWSKRSDLETLTYARLWTMDRDWIESRRDLFIARFGTPFTPPAKTLFEGLERAPDLITARLGAAPPTLLHGDFHLDNLLFARGEPVFLDWSRPVRGPGALNLAELLFAMTPLSHFGTVLEAYLTRFNERADQPLTAADLERQIGGAFLSKFIAATLGMATSQMLPPRGPQLIARGLEQMNGAAAFWYARDPELFTLMTGA